VFSLALPASVPTRLSAEGTCRWERNLRGGAGAAVRPLTVRLGIKEGVARLAVLAADDSVT